MAPTRASAMAGVLALLLAAGGGLTTPAAARAREPLASVLGITPGMPEAQAHRLLEPLGDRQEEVGGGEEEERGGAGLEREAWKLRDRRYAWIQLSVDGSHHVHAIQATLRPDGPGLRYADIGDPNQARKLGYTILTWDVPARAGRPGRRVTARGVGSVFTATVSIVGTD
jgi:hypothetical protein